MFLKRPESMPKIKNVEWLTENSVRLTVPCGYENGKQRKFRTTLKIPEGKTPLAKVRFIETEYTKFRAKVERGEVAEKQITVEKFAALWMRDDVKARNLSPVTVSGYENFLQAHILPALGKTRLDRLTPHTITRFYNELAKKPGRNGKPISSRYVCNVHGVPADDVECRRPLGLPDAQPRRCRHAAQKRHAEAGHLRPIAMPRAAGRTDGSARDLPGGHPPDALYRHAQRRGRRVGLEERRSRRRTGGGSCRKPCIWAGRASRSKRQRQPPGKGQ